MLYFDFNHKLQYLVQEVLYPVHLYPIYIHLYPGYILYIYEYKAWYIGSVWVVSDCFVIYINRDEFFHSFGRETASFYTC